MHPVVFRFGMRGSTTEDFLASSTDQTVIDRARAQLKLHEGERNLHINGLIDRAAKKSNLSWHWQYVDSKWDIVEVSFVLCDGMPSGVEANLATWLTQIGQFCPVGSYVKSESSKSH